MLSLNLVLRSLNAVWPMVRGVVDARNALRRIRSGRPRLSQRGRLFLHSPRFSVPELSLTAPKKGSVSILARFAWGLPKLFITALVAINDSFDSAPTE
jgi:hypothetical protein